MGNKFQKIWKWYCIGNIRKCVKCKNIKPSTLQERNRIGHYLQLDMM